MWGRNAASRLYTELIGGNREHSGHEMSQVDNDRHSRWKVQTQELTATKTSAASEILVAHSLSIVTR
jgi:hypothetical protein